MRPNIALIAAGLMVLAAGFCAAAADPYAGQWFNGDMSLTLSTSGSSLSGTFALNEGGRTGTIAGELLDGGTSARLTFQWQSEEGPGEFGAILRPAACGRLLQGTRWDASGVMTSLGLHRRSDLSPADLPDEDSPIAQAPDAPATGATRPPVSKPPTTATKPPATTSMPRPEGTEVAVFDNGNIGAVGNKPTRDTVFTTRQGHYITLIRNYHWNGGQGAIAGTIGLRDAAGKIYGPWQARNAPGSGRQNVLWLVEPNIILPPGTYTVLDSDPATWAQNAGSGYAGTTLVNGIPMEDLMVDPAPGGGPIHDPSEVGADPDVEPVPALPKLTLSVCTSLQNDRPVNAATRFTKPTRLYCWTEFNGMPEGTEVGCVWVGNGKALATSKRVLSGSGWVWFSYATTSPSGLPKGSYAVKLRVGDTVIGYQAFTVQ